MDAWIGYTLFAALMQSVRTAGQRQLAGNLGPMAATAARYVFGLPVAALYLWLVTAGSPVAALADALAVPAFAGWGALAGLAQIAATFWLVQLLQRRHFTVGTVFSKTEVILTAALGTLLFASTLSTTGWLAVIAGTAGVVVLSVTGSRLELDPRSLLLGLGAGLGFALTSLFLREASTSLQAPPVTAAALALAYTVCLQSITCCAYLLWREPSQLRRMRGALGMALFIGVTSALGSIGWYTAVTLQEAALVRALGQVELLIALAISHLWFRERLSRREFAGLLLVSASVLLLLLL